jgi:hypothetical protein
MAKEIIGARFAIRILFGGAKRMLKSLASLAGPGASSLLSFGVGLFLAAAIHTLIFEWNASELSVGWVGTGLKWIGPHRTYIYLVAAFLGTAALPFAARELRRLTASCFGGTIDTLPGICLLAAIGVFATGSAPVWIRLTEALTIIAFTYGSLHLVRTILTRRHDRTSSCAASSMDGFRLSGPVAAIREGDDPIEEWEQDLLDRFPLINVLAVKLLIAKKTIVVLDGKFGAGKTSVLNLLRIRLRKVAVVVPFSAWLPGSGYSLIESLLSDITVESKKQFIVPGLGRNTRRYARALAKSVPHLDWLTEILPEETQTDAIDHLKQSLQRMPRPVIVLIDDVDRMQKAEILALFKLLRGTAGIPNLSFVCACDKNEVMRIAGKAENTDGELTRQYLEKFFLDVFPITEPNPDTLRDIGVRRIVRCIKESGAFRDDANETVFRSNIETLWDRCFAPFCSNLRKIGILVNDLEGAAKLLQRDVDPVDLTLITLLRRYSPDVHALVASQRLILAGQLADMKKYEYLDEKSAAQRREELKERIEECCRNKLELDAVHATLAELFPKISELTRRVSLRRPPRVGVARTVLISEPSMFDAYFRYEVPKEIFGKVLLDDFIDSISAANGEGEIDKLFATTLESMDKGSSRREDFLWKLSLSTELLSKERAQELARSAMRHADQYTYASDIGLYRESFSAFGMAENVLHESGEPERIQLLREFVSDAGDDTMVFGLLQRLTDIFDAVSEGQIPRYPLGAVWEAFRERMRRKFGPASRVSIEEAYQTSDREALALWGQRDLSKRGIAVDPSDREMRDGFWVRYIGVSRKRLASAFSYNLMPPAIFQSDPTEFVDQRISIDVLRRLNSNSLPDLDLTKEEGKSLYRLNKLLNGDYKGGVPMADFQPDT